MDTVELAAVNRLLIRKQHLARKSHDDDVVRVAGDIGGLHGTGVIEPHLALFSRSVHLGKADLDRELTVTRRLVKVRCMRGTLYIVPREMVAIVYGATRAMIEKLSRRYCEFRGFVGPEYEALTKRVLRLLQGRQLAAVEIQKALETKMSLGPVLNLMCDLGQLARIPAGKGWPARGYRYGLFAEFLPEVELNRYGETEATARLGETYLRAFGPATEADLGWWVGMTKARARAALAGLAKRTRRIAVDGLGGDFVTLSDDMEQLKSARDGTESVNLLPLLDPYLMGYKERDRYVPPERYERVYDQSGNATATVLRDGRVIGVWDYSDARRGVVRVHLFNSIGKKLPAKVISSAREAGRFISGEDVEVQVVADMIPLSKRSYGAFMSPLREKTDTKKEGQA